MKIQTHHALDDRIREEMMAQEKNTPGSLVSDILDRYLLNGENRARLLAARITVLCSDRIGALPPTELAAVIVLAYHGAGTSIFEVDVNADLTPEVAP